MKKQTRRHVLSGLGSIALAASVPVAASALSPPDAELIELGKQLEISTARIKEADAITMATYPARNAATLPFPDVLRVRAEDKERFNIPRPTDKKHPGYYTTFDLHDLKGHKGSRVVAIRIAEYTPSFMADTDFAFAILNGTKDVVQKSVPFPEAQARVDEIVAAIEQWKTENDRIQDSLDGGLSDAEWERITDEQSELFEAILAHPATTIDGLRVKARAVKIIHSEEDVIELGDTTDDYLAASALNDILNMS